MNHRRPNPDELTPDDLFRPDAGPAAAYGAPLQQPEAQAAATQYLPPMPPAPEPQSYPQQPQSYAQPTQPMQQAYAAPGFPQQPTQSYGGPAQGPYDHGGYDQGGYGGYERYDDHGAYDDDPHRNRPSLRTLGIAVVAACAVVGIGLGVLLHGGSASGTQAGKGSTAAKHGATAGGTGNTGDKAAQLAQAQKLSNLLDTAQSNRQAVVNAVQSISQCQALPQAQQTLTQAAQARAGLVTQLDQLQVDALPSGQALVAKLTAGWQASQQADSHYAAWAAESMDPCHKKHHPKQGGEESAAVVASGNATTAKREAADLWNRIATANNLPEKTPGQL